jgi:hypothetical protein
LQRSVIALTAAVLGVALAIAVSACGGDDETTTTTTETGAAQTQTGTQTEQTTTGTSTTTTTTQSAADCGSDQVFSQSSGTCVDIRQGSNPCPPGEVPMADRPVCVPKE